MTTARLTNTHATKHLDFDDVPGVYKPVIGGLRHLSRVAQQPPDGTTVELLDGDTHMVTRWAKAYHAYDCHVCAEVWLDEHPPPSDELPAPRTPAPRRRRPYIDHTSPGAI